MSSHSTELPGTALRVWHEAAGAKMVDFGGWSMPLEYPSGTVTEHRAVRAGCGLFDVSHMGTLYVNGRQAIGDLNGLLTNDIARLGVGDAQYTLLCNETGGVIDDMLVTLLSADRALIVPNASNTAAVLAEVSQAVGAGNVEDRTLGSAILAVQGPSSAGVLDGLGLPTDHDYMTARTGSIQGVEVLVSRTGYTGEHGYELIVPSQSAIAVWEDVQGLPPVTPCGLGARDTLRTEMGYALHGQDISATIGPVAAQLSWAVAWDKPSFAGRGTLLEQRNEGVPQRLRGVLLRGRGIPRPGMSVVRSGGAGDIGDPVETVGTVTSGTFSPTLKQGIALALLDSDVTVGDRVAVDVRGRRIHADVVKPPFVDSSPK